jgi:hypothetical protein
VNINFPNVFDAIQAEVFNALGQKISDTHFQNQTVISIALPVQKGVYIVKVKIGSREYSRKIIKY